MSAIKQGLMNMIVKTALLSMDSAEEKGHLDGARTAKMHAHKYGFGGVSKQLNYICCCYYCRCHCSLMDFLPPRWRWCLSWLSVRYGTELKKSHSLVKDLFYAGVEVGNTWPSMALRIPLPAQSAIIFLALIAVANRARTWPHMKVNDHWQEEYESGICSCLPPVN